MGRFLEAVRQGQAVQASRSAGKILTTPQSLASLLRFFPLIEGQESQKRLERLRLDSPRTDFYRYSIHTWISCRADEFSEVLFRVDGKQYEERRPPPWSFT